MKKRNFSVRRTEVTIRKIISVRGKKGGQEMKPVRLFVTWYEKKM